MSHTPPEDADRIADYLAGELPSAEAAATESWIAEDGDRRALVDSVLSARRELDARWTDHVRVDADALAHDVAAAIRRSEPMRGTGRPAPMSNRATRGTRSALWRRAVPLSAVAALGTAIALMFARRTDHSAASTKSTTYTTVVGQQAAITLSNGSRAVLGPATTLTVSTAERGAGTAVTVTGQALFTVAHQRKAPFIVRTNNSVTRVLGTTFFVRQYEADARARIAVTDGRVAVQGTDRAKTTHRDVVLAAGMLGVIDDSGRVRVTPNIAIDDYSAWTNGKLVFRQTPVSDIVADLGRAYGANIQVRDSALIQRSLTWTVLVTHLTLSDVLEALSGVLNAHTVRSDGIITIVPGPLAQRKPNRSGNPFTLEIQRGK